MTPKRFSSQLEIHGRVLHDGSVVHRVLHSQVLVSSVILLKLPSYHGTSNSIDNIHSYCAHTFLNNLIILLQLRYSVRYVSITCFSSHRPFSKTALSSSVSSPTPATFEVAEVEVGSSDLLPRDGTRILIVEIQE